MRTVLGALALLLVLTGCGGEDQPAAADQSPTASATPSESAEPVYVESETCRENMQEIVDILDLITDLTEVGYDDLEDRYRRLSNIANRSVAACTDAVEEPFREAMYQYALLNAYLLVCDQGGKCDQQKLADTLRKANAAAAEASAAVGARE